MVDLPNELQRTSVNEWYDIKLYRQLASTWESQGFLECFNSYHMFIVPLEQSVYTSELLSGLVYVDINTQI